MKRRMLQLAVFAVGVWPIFHYALAAHYDMSPWKLGGWGMYATVSRDLKPRIRELRGEERRALDPSSVPETVHASINEYLERWIYLGQLASPDDAARRVLAARPDLAGVEIAVRVLDLNPDTGRLTEREVAHEYRRRSDGGLDVCTASKEHQIRELPAP